MKPEEQLWLNTLVRGLCDSVGLTHPNFDISEWKIIKEAREWLGTEDFNTICSYLKLEPSYILQLHEKIQAKTKVSIVPIVRHEKVFNIWRLLALSIFDLNHKRS